MYNNYNGFDVPDTNEVIFEFMVASSISELIEEPSPFCGFACGPDIDGDCNDEDVDENSEA